MLKNLGDNIIYLYLTPLKKKKKATRNQLFIYREKYLIREVFKKSKSKGAAKTNSHQV